MARKDELYRMTRRLRRQRIQKTKKGSTRQRPLIENALFVTAIQVPLLIVAVPFWHWEKSSLSHKPFLELCRLNQHLELFQETNWEAVQLLGYECYMLPVQQATRQMCTILSFQVLRAFSLFSPTNSSPVLRG